MLLHEMLARTALRHGGRTAVIEGGRRWTYAELDHRAARFASGLAALGVRPGERVGLMLRNLAEYPVAHFGISRAGCVSVHLPLRLMQREFDYVLERIAPTALVIDTALPEAMDWAGRHLPAGRIICAGGAAPAGHPAFPDLDADPSSPLPGDPDGPAAILFTSGTTGDPKGAIQPHRGRWISAQVAREDFGLTQEDVLAVASPLYHAAGLCTWYHAGVAAGAAAILMPAWDAGQFIATVERFGVTGAFAVPTQLAMLLKHPGFDPLRLRSLRVIAYGGASSEPDLIEALEHALPWTRLVQNYGQTETGPLFSLQPQDRACAPRALGRPDPRIEVELFAAPGRPAVTGEVGEIATRGPHLMHGYFGDAAATAEFFREGDAWGWTGDLGVRDADGLVTLVGRTRDTIISGGVNIYPSELEAVLRGHEAVADCAAFGIPDPVWGELPALAVVAKPGAGLDAGQIERLYERAVGRHKRPRAILFVPDLPFTPAGKLLRAELKRRHGVPGQTGAQARKL